jgi:gas vesicle protein
MSNLGKGAALFVGGAIVGAAVALLLAPKSGEEIRQQMADYADEAKKRMQDYCEQLKQDLAEANTPEKPADEPIKEEA